jgi:hypothetical protein
MKSTFFKLGISAIAMVIAFGCNKQLDLFPINETTSEQVFNSLEGYQQSLAKVYGAMATTGSGGPGSTDLPFGGDPGWSDFFRSYWKAQELTTDEAVVAWSGDPGLQDFNTITYASNNPFVQRNFSRPLFQIVLANEFIRECADDRLSRRGISGADAARIRIFKEEARFLRAYQYWVLLDLFRNPPFVTEANEVGKILPPQTNPVALYNYLERELLDLSNTLPPPRSQPYGHADRGAAWALLARLSLNAEVYTGGQINRYQQAREYAQKVINEGGYSLADNYAHLFGADNDLPDISREFIFVIQYDGINTQTYGGTTFLVNASASNTTRNIFGISGGNAGWSGLRTRREFVALFPDSGKPGSADKRAMFITTNRTPNILLLTDYNQGYVVSKFRNVTRDGQFGKNRTAEFVDIDMPIFRLPEMYLIYTEATLRGGGGDLGLAATYINNLRRRAYGNDDGNISVADINLDFVLNERARELYWEGHRRTDLIRYNRFTTADYLWQWKGGRESGGAVSDHLKILPIPANELSNNPNLRQNPGY